jgi:TonB family protein
MGGKRDAGQHFSDGSALILTCTLATLLLATRTPKWLTPPVARSDQGIELTLQSVPAPPVPPPALPLPVPARHVKTPRTVASERAITLPREEQEAPEDAALVAPAAPAPQAQAADSHADLEAQYAAQLRADIDRRTHPPDSAQYRLHHPAGEVRVRFLVTRNGVPKGPAVVRSSGSSLLDDAAVTIVASGHYATMPAEAFAGETEHAFIVTIEFRAASLVAGVK